MVIVNICTHDHVDKVESWTLKDDEPDYIWNSNESKGKWTISHYEWVNLPHKAYCHIYVEIKYLKYNTTSHLYPVY